jgi:hypothetical protein
MTVHLDHTGNPVTLKGPATSTTITRLQLPAGTPVAGQFMSVSNFATGVLTLGFASVTGLPTGGSTGQLLRRTSSSYEWYSLPPSLPSGGSTGQALVKTSAGDYEVGWQTMAGGGGIGGSLDLGAITDTGTSVDMGSVVDAVGTSPLTLVLQP